MLSKRKLKGRNRLPSLLERCPRCKKPFQIPALWTDGKCYHCGMRFTAMVKYQERIKKTG